MTNSYIENKNHIAFHPSYYLHDLINQLNMTQDEFAERVNTTPKTISKILNGLVRVTPKLAYQISLVTNTSAELWNNLQKKYDEVQVIVEDQKLLDQESKLLDIIDYKYFIDNKFLPVARSREEKVLNLRKFLKVASLNVISKATPSANFRMSNGSLNDKNIINSYIWLQT